MTTLSRLTELLAERGEVQALVLCGSQAANVADEWSDLDALAVTHPLDIRAAERIGHALSQVGRVFNAQIIDHEDGHFTLRWAYTTFERIDLMLWDAEVLDGGPIPLTPPFRVIFNYATPDNDRLITPAPPPLPDEEYYRDSLHERTTALRDMGITALVKAVRGDLLIGLHLAIGMLRELLVLHMQLRDMQRGTTVHRTGSIEDEAVLAIPEFPSTAEGIIDRVAYAAKHFDRLAREIDPTYKGDNGPLLAAVRVARQQLRARGW
jgi:hypothetical protein